MITIPQKIRSLPVEEKGSDVDKQPDSHNMTSASTSKSGNTPIPGPSTNADAIECNCPTCKQLGPVPTPVPGN